MSGSVKVFPLLLHRHKLVLPHVEVRVLHLTFEQGKRHDLAVDCRGDHQICRVERYALYRSVSLEYLSLEELFEMDGIQDGYHSRVKAHNYVSVVVGTILQRSDSALASLENVDCTGLLTRSVVNHHVRAPFAVQAREEELLRNYFLVLLVDVGDSVRPLKPGKDGEVYSPDDVARNVEIHALQVDASHNSASLVENYHLHVFIESGHEHFRKELNVEY